MQTRKSSIESRFIRLFENFTMIDDRFKAKNCIKYIPLAYQYKQECANKTLCGRLINVTSTSQAAENQILHNFIQKKTQFLDLLFLKNFSDDDRPLNDVLNKLHNFQLTSLGDTSLRLLRTT